MYSVTIINIVAVLLILFSTMVSRKINVLPGIIFMLIVFFSIRMNYGNDYPSYEFIFKYVNSHSDIEIRQSRLNIEQGWVILNRIFYPLGFRGLIVFCTIVQFGVTGWFISKYVEPRYQWYGLAVYLFYSNLMLVDLSMLRQMLAINIFLLSIPFMLQKRWIVYYAMMLLAFTLHKSAIITFLIPLLMFAVNVDYRKLMVVYVGLILGLMLVPSVVYRAVDVMLDSGSFDRYRFYWNRGFKTGGIGTVTGFGVLLEMLSGFYLLYLMRNKTIDMTYRLLILMYCSYMVLIPGALAFQMVHRLQFYFLNASIPVVALLLKYSKRDVGALLFTFGWMAIIFLDYTSFFYNSVWTRMYMHYHTIFD
ncbi:MAG: EpsG family protein [Muribaculum sp.]|nr:EpsG family protein [Muribaculum sp.]